MKSKYEKTVFVEDNKGKRYVCYFNDEKEHSHKLEKLDDNERSYCKPIEFPWN